MHYTFTKLCENEYQELLFKIINAKEFKRIYKDVSCMSLGLPSQVVFYQNKTQNLICISKPGFVENLLVSRKHTSKIYHHIECNENYIVYFYLMCDIFKLTVERILFSSNYGVQIQGSFLITRSRGCETVHRSQMWHGEV